MKASRSTHDVGEWCSGEGATQEAEHQEGSDVLRQRTADVPADVGEEGHDEDVATTVGLGKGAPEERTCDIY